MRLFIPIQYFFVLNCFCFIESTAQTYKGTLKIHSSNYTLTVQVDDEKNVRIWGNDSSCSNSIWGKGKLSNNDSLMIKEAFSVETMKPYYRQDEGEGYQNHLRARKHYFHIEVDESAYKCLQNDTLYINSKFGSIKQKIRFGSLFKYVEQNDKHGFSFRIQVNAQKIERNIDELTLAIGTLDNQIKNENKITWRKGGNFDADIYIRTITPSKIHFKIIDNELQISSALFFDEYKAIFLRKVKQ